MSEKQPVVTIKTERDRILAGLTVAELMTLGQPENLVNWAKALLEAAESPSPTKPKSESGRKQ